MKWSWNLFSFFFWSIWKYVLRQFLTKNCMDTEIENFSDFWYIFDYLSIVLRNYQQRIDFIDQNAESFKKILEFIFKGILLKVLFLSSSSMFFFYFLSFLDGGVYVISSMYNRIVEYYVILLFFDKSGVLHQYLCGKVLGTNWMLANVSTDILRIYYRFSSSIVFSFFFIYLVFKIKIELIELNFCSFQLLWSKTFKFTRKR